MLLFAQTTLELQQPFLPASTATLLFQTPQELQQPLLPTWTATLSSLNCAPMCFCRNTPLFSLSDNGSVDILQYISD